MWGRRAAKLCTCRHLSLTPPEPADWEYVLRTLGRECRKMGDAGVRRVGHGATVAIDFLLAVEQ